MEKEFTDFRFLRPFIPTQELLDWGEYQDSKADFDFASFTYGYNIGSITSNSGDNTGSVADTQYTNINNNSPVKIRIEAGRNTGNFAYNIINSIDVSGNVVFEYDSWVNRYGIIIPQPSTDFPEGSSLPECKGAGVALP